MKTLDRVIELSIALLISLGVGAVIVTVSALALTTAVETKYERPLFDF